MPRYKIGEQKQCVTCGSYAVQDENFRDSISKHEFEISGMCQQCQDFTFKRAGGYSGGVLESK